MSVAVAPPGRSPTRCCAGSENGAWNDRDSRMGMTVAEEFAAGLAKLGVRHAFGVSGGAISFFWAALGAGPVQVTHFRHESGAAFAACEASIATRAPVVVFVTTGPGLTNVLTGAYAARH